MFTLHTPTLPGPAYYFIAHSKFQIATKLKFAGCVVFQDGVQTDPDCVASLANFPIPKGLSNQLAFFIPDYQHHTVSLRQLTGKGRTFLWLPEHQVDMTD